MRVELHNLLLDLWIVPSTLRFHLPNNLPDIDYIGFNTLIEPFNNPLVTQAINYALGGGFLIEAANFGGIGLPATSPLANTVWGHVEVAPFTADLDRARQLLAEAGYPDGFSTSI